MFGSSDYTKKPKRTRRKSAAPAAEKGGGKAPYKIIMTAIFAAILVILPVMTFLTLPAEDKPFSENENRYLTGFPALTFDTFRDESFMEGFEKWFSDRFFGREGWIKVKNTVQRLSGKTDINGVYTSEGQMMELWYGFDSDYIDLHLRAMNRFSQTCPDKPVYFILAPTSQEVYSSLLPSVAPAGSQNALLEYCRNGLDTVQVINVMNTLKMHSSDYICYRTDHHWTSLGAYYAYYEASKTLGFKPRELSDYNIEHASSSFRGTLYSKTLDDSVTPDVIDYYHPKDGETLKLTVRNGTQEETYDSLYFREYLDVKDKYSSFMGPNSPYMDIETGVDGPSILIFKDSYAHSFIPFLTSHYSRITVLDLRYINDGYSRYADPENYDSVLFLYNAITFSGEKDIRKLNSRD